MSLQMLLLFTEFTAARFDSKVNFHAPVTQASSKAGNQFTPLV